MFDKKTFEHCCNNLSKYIIKKLKVFLLCKEITIKLKRGLHKRTNKKICIKKEPTWYNIDTDSVFGRAVPMFG